MIDSEVEALPMGIIFLDMFHLAKADLLCCRVSDVVVNNDIGYQGIQNL